MTFLAFAFLFPSAHLYVLRAYSYPSRAIGYSPNAED